MTQVRDPNRFPLIILPASVLNETFTDLDEAKSLAAKRTAQYSEDFVICIITELGRFESVSPIWIQKENKENPNDLLPKPPSSFFSTEGNSPRTRILYPEPLDPNGQTIQVPSGTEPTT